MGGLHKAGWIMAGTCGCGGGEETLVFACAGAAYSGQLTNRVGVDLMKKGSAKLLCIASIAADRPDKMERARKARARVAIDGCDDYCCKRIMEEAGLPVDLHVVVTDLGIEKSPAEPQMLTDAKKMVDHIERALAKGRQLG
jgi:uncharacterized metal-binding protein